MLRCGYRRELELMSDAELLAEFKLRAELLLRSRGYDWAHGAPRTNYEQAWVEAARRGLGLDAKLIWQEAREERNRELVTENKFPWEIPENGHDSGV